MIHEVVYEFGAEGWMRDGEAMDESMAVPFEKETRWVWLTDFTDAQWPPLSESHPQRCSPAVCLRIDQEWTQWKLIWHEEGNDHAVWQALLSHYLEE